MRQIITRRIKTKAAAFHIAVLDQKKFVAELEGDPLIVVLARRDLVFLQALFAALDRGKCIDYSRMQKAVTAQLDSMSKDTCPTSPKKTSCDSSEGKRRKPKHMNTSIARKKRTQGSKPDSMRYSTGY